MPLSHVQCQAVILFTLCVWGNALASDFSTHVVSRTYFALCPGHLQHVLAYYEMWAKLMLLLTSASWHVTVYSLYYCEERVSHMAHILIAVADSILLQSSSKGLRMGAPFITQPGSSYVGLSGLTAAEATSSSTTCTQTVSASHRPPRAPIFGCAHASDCSGTTGAGKPVQSTSGWGLNPIGATHIRPEHSKTECIKTQAASAICGRGTSSGEQWVTYTRCLQQCHTLHMQQTCKNSKKQLYNLK